MKKIFALLLAAAVLMSLAACGSEPAPTAATTQNTAATTLPTETLEAVEQVTVDNPIKSLYLSMNLNETDYFYLNAWEDGEGGAQVELQADIRKVATLDASVLHGITKALEESGLAALNGVNGDATQEGGTQGCSVFAEYADGSTLGASVIGTLPKEFSDGYAAMEQYFKRLLKDEPVYVPQPIIEGTVDESMMAEMLAVLNGSGIDGLDSFVIAGVAKDEFMGHALGMADTAHVVAGVSCSPMIQPNAYSFVIVKVDDKANIEAVRKDLAENLNWAKWVCVRASSAIIAQKGDLVLCLMGSGNAYGRTKAGIEKAGWESLETYQDNGK